MGASNNDIYDSWQELLGGNDASGWLSAFMESPEKAVADLLWDRFYFGPLNLVHRAQLLTNWLELLRDTEQFATRLDKEFTTWVEHNWGHNNQNARLLASAWLCLFNVVEFSSNLHAESRLENCAHALRARFGSHQRFLGSFSTGPAADPLGLYLGVIAQFQDEDRSLASFWYNMCDLPDGVPFYHAGWAMLGLRRLKAPDRSKNGFLGTEVFLGLVRLARSFDRLLNEGRIAASLEHIAKATFQRVAMRTASAYPHSKEWSRLATANSGALQLLPERPNRWLEEAIPDLVPPKRVPHKSASTIKGPRPHPSWTERSVHLAARLKKADRTALPEADVLLTEETRYAEVTGDAYHVTHTLCNFSRSILSYAPELARRWAEKALEWAPHNSYPWNTLTTVLLHIKDYEGASTFAWVAYKRFPEAVAVYTNLAEVLKVRGYRAEAADIYRQAIARFPENNHAHTGLARVLTLSRSYQEAIDAYERAIELFPDDDWNYSGLAAVWQQLGRFDKAEEIFRKSMAKGIANVTTYFGLAHLLVKKGRSGREEALTLIKKVLESKPNDRYALEFMRIHSIDQKKSAAEFERLIKSWEQAVDLLKAKAEQAAEPRMVVEPIIAAEQETPEPSPPAEQITAVEPPTAAQPTSAEPLTAAEPTIAVEPPTAAQPPIAEPLTVAKASDATPVTATHSTHEKAETKPDVQATPDVEPPATTPLSRKVLLDTQTKKSKPHTPTPAIEPTAELQTAADSEQPLEASVEIDSTPTTVEYLKVPVAKEAEAAPAETVGPPEASTPEASASHQQVQFNSVKVAALVAEANFFRLRAKTDEQKTSAHRKMAKTLIDKAKQIAADDPQILAEQAALSADQGNDSEAFDQVSALLENYSASVPVLALKARLDRNRAEEAGLRLTQQTLTDLTAMPLLLREKDETLAPLAQFQKGMAAMALQDGDVRKKTASDAFSAFLRMLAKRAGSEQREKQYALHSDSRTAPRFHEWLHNQVNSQIFTGLVDDNTRGIREDRFGELDQVWQRQRRDFEAVEAVVVDRLVFRSI